MVAPTNHYGGISKVMAGGPPKRHPGIGKAAQRRSSAAHTNAHKGA